MLIVKRNRRVRLLITCQGHESLHSAEQVFTVERLLYLCCLEKYRSKNSLEEGELLEASKNVTNGVQGRFVHNKDSCQNFIVYHEFLETLYYYLFTR